VLPFVGESIFADGVLYVENAPLQPEGSAITLGEVWCWRAREGKLSGHFNQALRSPHTNLCMYFKEGSSVRCIFRLTRSAGLPRWLTLPSGDLAQRAG